MIQRSLVTVAVMARAPVPGFCKTRLAQSLGDGVAADIYQNMLLDTLEAYGKLTQHALLPPGVSCGANPKDVDCSELEIQLVLMAAPEHQGVKVLRELAPKGWRVIAQQGADLSARVLHAVATLSVEAAHAAVSKDHPKASVFHFVILVGSDSPSVQISSICDYLQKQHAGHDFRNTALMGPCLDGGYYLIGVPAGDTRLLTDMPWSTQNVALETRRRCQLFGIGLTELPMGADVDVLDDLKRLRDELREFPERAPRTANMLDTISLGICRT